MRVPWRWLTEYVELPWGPQEAARRFTGVGLKVENPGHALSVAGVAYEKIGVSGVLTAKVRSVSPHPRRPDLKVGLVDTGRERLTMVSGAPSFDAGNTVLAAVPGASLPGGIRIEARELAEVVSQGMVVCANEILYGAEHRPGEDIIVLPPEVGLGLPAQEVLGLDDWVFVFDLTVNYSHCLCVLGVAIEAAALSQSPLRLPDVLAAWDWAGPRGSRPPKDDPLYAGNIRVELPDSDLCPRYVGKIVRGMSPAYSPVEIERRLMLAGMRPINALVDATNYVMLETGQPLHAFNLDKLEGDTIWARRSRPGETIVTLDGISHDLDEGTLVIADGKGPVAVAGVMGGGRTEVSAETRNVLLESAYFAPIPVRRTSQKLKLRTEAALRFEKGIDPTAQAAVAERAAQMIRRMAGGVAVPGRADADLLRARPSEITLSSEDVRRTLGERIPADDCERIFVRLGFEVSRASSVSTAGDAGDTVTVTVPPRRVDIESYVDLIEEIARHHGYDRFEDELMSPTVRGGPPGRDFVCLERIRDFLVNLGGVEIVTTSLLSRDDHSALGWKDPDPRGDPVPLMNPLSSEESCLRTGLLPGVLKILRANQNMRAPGGLFWETGAVFFRPGREEELPVEAAQLALASYGTLLPATWAGDEKTASFYRFKGVAESLLSLLGIGETVFVPGAGMPFHPGKSARVAATGSTVGEIGEIHPTVQEEMDIPLTCVAGWFSIDALLRLAKEAPYETVSKLMPVERDLAIIVDEEVPSGDVLRAVRLCDEELESVTLFDLYRKPPVPEGRKSLAMRLIYQPKEKSLTEEELSSRRRRILERLEREFRATPRL